VNSKALCIWSRPLAAGAGPRKTWGRRRKEDTAFTAGNGKAIGKLFLTCSGEHYATSGYHSVKHMVMSLRLRAERQPISPISTGIGAQQSLLLPPPNEVEDSRAFIPSGEDIQSLGDHVPISAGLFEFGQRGLVSWLDVLHASE
jgi:hypothetical protein